MKNIISRFIKLSTIITFTLNKQINLEDKYITNQQIQTYLQRLYLAPLDCALSQFKLFSLGEDSLGKQVAAHLDITLGQFINEKFNDGQCNLQFMDSVRGHKVYLIKTFTQKNINDGIMELLLGISSLKKQGAQNVVCIIPFFPYSQGMKIQVQQDKVFFTCFGADILKLLEDSGCDCVITFNSLMSYPKGYVNSCKFININAPDLFVGHLATKKLINPTLVSSSLNKQNLDSIYLIKESLKKLNFDCPISTFNGDQLIGQNIQGKDIILYSNIIRSGKGLINQSKFLHQKGARSIHGCYFHSLVGKKELQNVLNSSYISEFDTTNSFSHQKSYNRAKTISISRIIAQIISLFQQQKNLSNYRQERQRQKIQFIKKLKNLNGKQLSKQGIEQYLI